MASSITVENIPEDLYREIIKEQGKVKIYTGTQFNLSKTVIKMLKDYIKCKKANNFSSEEV